MTPEPPAATPVAAPASPHRTASAAAAPRSWSYPYGQYELALLAGLVREGRAANRWVDYSDNAGRVEQRARFRRAVRGPGRVSVMATGPCRVTVDGGTPADGTSGAATIALPSTAREVVVEVTTAPGVPAALTVTDGEPCLVGPGWDAWTPAWDWSPATVRSGEAPPHAAGTPVVTITAHAVDGAVDLDLPVLGRPVLDGSAQPVVSSGESLPEALAGPGDHQETRHDVVRRADGRWSTRHALGFRHLRVQPPVTGPVTIETLVHPVARRGSFRCSDDVLSQIWATSADTLHLCLQGLVVDGIKRDRMPWAGDLASTTLSGAYAFGAGDVVRDTWVALGQPRFGHVNGIGDYTLWWLVTSRVYALHFAVGTERGRLAEHVDRVLTGLLPEVGPDGVLRPQEHPGQFARVFLDWGVTVEDGRDPTALGMLWSWALTSAGTVLTAAGHPSAARWADLARTLEGTLRARAWDAAGRTWREYLDDSSPTTPYANLLAVLSGLHEGPPDAVREVLLGTTVGTPFMTAYRLRALGLVGGRRAAVTELRRLWGGMLDRGARTFWEEFPTDGGDLAMYGRPFGKSLCHAWASGPAALLPELVLGVRPVDEGWSAFTVDPDLGGLGWAEAVVPTPAGEIVVRCDGEGVVVDVPRGSSLVHAGRRHGPGRHLVPHA